MLRKYIPLTIIFFISFIVGLNLHLTNASAAVLTTPASLEVQVLDDNRAYVTGIPMGVVIKDAAENIVTSNTIDSTTGKRTINGFNTTGTYIVTITDSTISISTKVNITSYGTKVVKFTYVSSAKINPKKSGAIGGLVIDESNNSLAGATIKVTSPTVTWETKSTSNGTFKIYLPIGRYKVITLGLETLPTDNNYKNLSSDINVIAGHTVSPLYNMNAKTPWGIEDLTLGYTLTDITKANSQIVTNGIINLDDITNDTKVIGGKAKNDSIIYLYSVDSNGIYTLLTSTKVLNSVLSGIGTFKLNLPAIQPGKKLSLKVVDKAFNEFEDKMSSPLPLLDATVIPASVANYGVDVTLTISGSTVGYIKTETTLVTAGGITLTPTTDFTISSGKLTIKKGKGLLVGSNTISIANPLFNPIPDTTQIVTASTLPAPTLTCTVGPGTAEGSTHVNATADLGNTLKYIISSTSISYPKLMSAEPIGLTPVPLGDILGVDPLTNKYIGIYEINSSGLVVKYKQIILITSTIKPDTIVPTYVTGATLDVTNTITTLTFNENIYAIISIADLKASTTISTDGGITFNPLGLNDTISIVDNMVIINFNYALTPLNNNIRISLGALKDAWGNTNQTDIITETY